MLKISTRTWNNILIFTVLGLILVLNLDKFRSEGPRSRLIVPEGEYIISMQIHQVEIEMAGQVWRVDPQGIQPEVVPDSERLREIVSAWQQAYISPAGIDFDIELFESPEVLVTLSLAGESNTTVVALTIVENQLFFVLEKQVFVLNSPSIKALLEPIIIVKQ